MIKNNRRYAVRKYVSTVNPNSKATIAPNNIYKSALLRRLLRKKKNRPPYAQRRRSTDPLSKYSSHPLSANIKSSRYVMPTGENGCRSKY
jgi:hypothetical protein